MAEVISRQTLRERSSSALKLRVQGTVTATPSGTVATVPAVGDIFSPARAPLTHYTWEHGLSSYTDVRRIITYDETTGDITTNRAHGLTTNDVVSVYQLLIPEDWNNAINDALRSLYYIERISLPLIADQNEYSLAPYTWLQAPMQVEDVRFRLTDLADVIEESAPGYNVIPDSNTLTLNIHWLPSPIAGKSIVVVARRYYDELSTDAATTNCPVNLILPAVKVEALRRVWHLLGDEKAKQLFGSEMTEATRELSEAKTRWIPRVTQSSMSLDSRFAGPEFALKTGDWPW